MVTAATSTLSQHNETPHLDWIDLSRHLDVLADRVDRMDKRQSRTVSLVNETPSSADEIIAKAFESDATIFEIGEILRSTLLGRQGAVIVTLAQADADAERLQKLQLLVGYALGHNVNHRSEDQPERALFEITPRTDVRYGGNGENASSIGPHTDGSGVQAIIDVLGLCCIAQTQGSGGQTLVSNALQAVLSLTEKDRTLLAQPWPRTNPYDRKAEPTTFVRRPIALLRVPFEFSYHPQRIRQALDRCGEATPERFEALANLDAALWRYSTAVKLERGELLLVNNRRFGHGRIGFAHDPMSPRRLERQWISWRASEARLSILRHE